MCYNYIHFLFPRCIITIIAQTNGLGVECYATVWKCSFQEVSLDINYKPHLTLPYFWDDCHAAPVLLFSEPFANLFTQ